MKAAPAFRGPILPKKCLSKTTLRECTTSGKRECPTSGKRECTTSGKRENVVLIELSDDFGDVHILDVPESFQEKFRKISEHHVNVIKIDDDEVENGGGVCDMDNDATTSSRSSSRSAGPSSNYDNINATINNGYPPTSAACFSIFADVDEDSVHVSEGNTPVKLSKSKRTYSDKAIPRNCYGINPDSERCSSESDGSDCEVMEGSFEKPHEQWYQAFVKRRRNKSCDRSDAVNKASTSTAFQPAHNSDEIAAEHPEAASQQSNSYAVDHESIAQKLAEESKFSQQDCDTGLFTRRNDDRSSSSNVEGGTSETSQSVHYNAEQLAAEYTKLPGEKFCFTSSVNYDINSDSHEQMAEQSMFAEQNYDAKETGKESAINYSTYVTKGVPYQDLETNAAVTDGERGVGKHTMLSSNFGCDNNCEGKLSYVQNDIIMDRQKIKETDEYKRAMEEELASRQQQLQRQAEEAQRLRSKKRAEKMRILDNERRQKQRVEEVRETRRKDEENLNLKEKLRVEIRKQLRKLETTCGDMASLLRCLGIHVGGGFFPSPNEVQAAYKRACLKFHPDRLSSTDLYQQVEAEEKFKLISNMKEKFLSR